MAFKNNCAIKNKSLRGFCAKQKLRNNVQQQKQFLLVQHSMVFSCSITIKKKKYKIKCSSRIRESKHTKEWIHNFKMYIKKKGEKKHLSLFLSCFLILTSYSSSSGCSSTSAQKKTLK